MPFSKFLENLTAPFKRIKNRSLVLALGFLILTFCLLLFWFSAMFLGSYPVRTFFM